jgi:hypothetical protein
VGYVGPDPAAVDEAVDRGEGEGGALVAVGGAQAGDAFGGGFGWVGGG